MITVVRAQEAKRRTSFGVSFDLLAEGPASMMTLMRYSLSSVIPFHSHPNEQIGYVLAGRIRVLTKAAQAELGVGDSYVIPAGIEHSIEILQEAQELQVFTPPRPEFR